MSILERKLQCELNIASVARMLHPAKVRSITDIAIRVLELSVVKDIEEFRAKFEMLALTHLENLLH